MKQQNNSQSASLVALLIIGATAAVIYLPWLDDNHRWWGDFALYLAHARNIAEGLPYAATGYVIHPDMSWLSPPAYPPVYSFLLAPVYSLFGLNLFAPKLLNFLIFLFLIGLFHQFSSHRLNTRPAVFGATAALAVSPWFWQMKNLILSDIPFVFFIFISVLIASRVYDPAGSRNQARLWSVLLGAAFYLAYGTRSLGITLPVALVIFDLIKFRKIHLNTLTALAVFAGCYALQHLLLDVDKSYASAMVAHAVRDSGEVPANMLEKGVLLVEYLGGNLIDRSREYALVIQGYWDNGFSLWPRILMVALTGLLTLSGFIATVKKRLSFTEVFVIVYLGVLLLVPFIQGYRYLLPLLPFLLFYLFRGAETAASYIGNRQAVYLPTAVTLLVLLSHVGFYTTQFPRDTVAGVKDPDATALFNYIRQATDKDALIIHDKPRIIALFTGRRASVYLPDHQTEALWNYFDSVNAAYLIFNTKNPIDDFRHYNALIQNSADRLEAVFENESFAVYRINASGR